MSKKPYSILKFRRGNTAVSNALTGAQGELFVDLQANTLVMHDGVTTGGHRIATENDIINIQGIDDTQNTNIQTVYDQANSSNVLAQAAFDYANTIIGTENDFIESAYNTANDAYNQANTANLIAQSAFDYANTLSSGSIDQSARDTANGAFGQANTSANDIVIIQGVNDTQNTDITNVNNLAQGAFDQANTSDNDIIVIQGVNDTQNTDITNVNNLAQGAFDAANAIVIPSLGNYTFDGDTITNNITDSITLQTGGDNWIFGTDGELTLPSGGHIGATKGGTMLDAGNGYDTSLTTFYANGNYAACVTGYAADGRLIITTYKDGGTDPSKQWTFDTDGNLTIPGGAKVGDIFNDGYGFGWQSPPDGGYAAITSNNILNYLAVDDDLLYTQVGDNRWSFESTGVLTVPGDIVPDANNEYSLGSAEFQWKSLFISNNTIYIENIPLSLKSNGNTNILTVGSGANITTIASENYVQSFQNIDGGSSTAIYSYELLNLDGGGA